MGEGGKPEMLLPPVGKKKCLGFWGKSKEADRPKRKILGFLLMRQMSLWEEK